MKRILQAALSLVFAGSAVFAGAGVASADVVVPPGASGHVCSTYSYMTGNPKLYWQTCAWADDNEVYFTVNFGNSSGSDWSVDFIHLGYWKSGVENDCRLFHDFVVPAHSVKSTPTSVCAFQRSRAAYQAWAYVEDRTYSDARTSDTLQVQ